MERTLNNQIYTITNAMHIQTRYWDACLNTLNNGQQSDMLDKLYKGEYYELKKCY